MKKYLIIFLAMIVVVGGRIFSQAPRGLDVQVGIGYQAEAFTASSQELYLEGTHSSGVYDDFSKTIEESFKSTFSNTVIDTTLLFEEVDYGTGFITLLLGTHIEMTLDDTTIRTSEEDLDTNFLIGGEIGYLFHLVESNVFTLYLGPSFGLQYNTIESTEYLNVRDTYGYYTILITETSKMSNFKPYIGLNLDARFYFTERFYINAGVDGIISYNFFNITLSRDGNGDNILSEFTGAERVKDEAMTIGAKAFGASIRPTISIGYRF